MAEGKLSEASEKNVPKYVDLVQKHLDKAGVKVDKDALKTSLVAAHEDMVLGCDQCANGWRW
jgi:hypothetical protein